MRISDWSSDVCSSDLAEVVANDSLRLGELPEQLQEIVGRLQVGEATPPFGSLADGVRVLILCGRDEGSVSTPSFDQVYAQLNEQRVSRSEEHTSELQSLMRISYAGFRLKKKTTH